MKKMTKEEKQQYYTLLLERARRKSRIDYFTFLRHLSPDEFTWNWHHKYCCQILQDWIMTDKHPFLMIFMPPQHQKSTMLTEFLPAWAFGQSIHYQALLIMYNSTQAKKYNRKIQRIMDSNEYKLIFPETRLNEKRVVTSAEGSYIKNSEEFEIVGGRGFLKSVGVGGGIAGNPAKLAFLDDLIKNVQEANSMTYRERTHEWYTDELEARLHNDSKVAFTITRRHEDDQAGRLLKRDGLLEEGGKWKVVKIPAIKVDNSNPDDPRKIGDALFPELHSLKRLQYIQEKEPRTFAGLYQQEPKVKGGDLIKGEWFKIMKPSELPFNMNYVVFNAVIDGAWTEKVSNDPTAIGYCYHDKRNNILYIRGMKSIRKKISKAIEFVSSDARINGVTNQGIIHIELKSSGEAFKDYLFQAGFNCDGISNDLVRKGKLTRVNESESQLRGGRVVLIDEGNWIKPFVSQCEQFPNGKHDDEVDVLTYMIHLYLLTGGNPYILL
jgi:predicted phage terminase large subunit-like protein